MTTTPTPRRGIPITLADGQEYRLRYTLGTLRQMREKFGKEMEQGLGQGQVADVLLMGLRDHHPNLTKEQLEDLVDGENLKDVTEAMMRALGAGGKVTPPPPVPPPTPPAETTAAIAPSSSGPTG